MVRPPSPGAALLLTSYLDVLLEALIKTRLAADEDVLANLFSGDGAAMGTMHQKTEMAYALGLIGKNTRRDITETRWIRNRFAHWVNLNELPEPITFRHRDIAQKCKSLWIPKNCSLPGKPTTPRKLFVETMYELFYIAMENAAGVTYDGKPDPDMIF